jgi:hypothetical protein
LGRRMLGGRQISDGSTGGRKRTRVQARAIQIVRTWTGNWAVKVIGSGTWTERVTPRGMMETDLIILKLAVIVTR